MSARYWVLASQEIMDGNAPWPEGLRVIGGPYDAGAGHLDMLDMRWWLLEGDGAPATLDGKRFALICLGPATSRPAEAEPVTVILSELPPVHLRG